MTRSAQFETKIEKARSALLERQHLQTRLQDLFLTIKESSLYTKKLSGDEKESLIAIFDHGIDPEPAFSGPVLARIYVDEKHRLALALWPIDKQKKNRAWRNEILFSNVDEVEFQFLGNKAEEGIAPVNSQLAWHSRWSGKRGENPSMVRLKIQQNGESLAYAFFFSSPEPIATYWEGGFRS